MESTHRIKSGIWKDYDRSTASSLQLTMSLGSANIFIAVWATVITLTASRSWKLFRFLIYHCRNHHLPRSATIREQEVHLRTAETDFGTSWQMFSILQR